MEMISLIGIFDGVNIFFVSVFVSKNRNVLMKVEIGISVWCWGLVSFFVMWGVINLRNVMFFVVVMYEVVSMIVVRRRICFFFLIVVFSLVVNWFLSCKMFK